MPLDLAQIRQQFPILNTPELVYLDNAATSQKPQVVLDAMTQYYRTSNANAHRGMHQLAEAATVAYEQARQTVADFIHCKPYELVFTKNCTESINLLAKSITWQPGDAVVLTALEHHSNIVPWQQLAEHDVEILWIDCDEQGQLNLNQLDEYLATNTVRLVSVTGLSNVLGVRPPLEIIIQKAHAAHTLVHIDAAQLIAHHPVDASTLDCDFLSFSGHKLYGPTGIGALYGKRNHLEQMQPFLGGGSMIQEVTTSGFTPAEIPLKFEAGSPPVAEAVGLATAIDWYTQFAWQDIETHETSLLQLAIKQLSTIDGLTILGTPESACVSFTIDGVHPHDLTDVLGKQGVCLRAGHHCAQPLHDKLGIGASTRLSIGIYNTEQDIASCISTLTTVIQSFLQ